MDEQQLIELAIELAKEYSPYVALIVSVLAAGDGIAGIVIPDKWLPYIGATRRIVNKLITEFKRTR